MTKITPEQFVTEWMRQSSREDVARALNISVAYVGAILYRLRKAGVRLPNHNCRLRKLDVEKLNALVTKELSNDE